MMMKANSCAAAIAAAALGALLAAGGSGCNKSEAAQTVSHGQMVSAQHAADMIHTTLAADRAVYAQEIVQRLVGDQKVQVQDPASGSLVPLEAREDWKTEHGKLPLPAQMFRMGAEKVLKANQGFSYLLLSPWPVNKQNLPKTDAEKKGLEAIMHTHSSFYTHEVLDGTDYFVAVYPDPAVAPACVNCHNKHPDSPRRDFKVGDVMGGVVIRFPLQ